MNKQKTLRSLGCRDVEDKYLSYYLLQQSNRIISSHHIPTKTNIKEIRAKTVDNITIGEFKINDLKLVDLRKNTSNKIMNDVFSSKCTKEFWCNYKTLNNFIKDITKFINEDDSLCT